MCVCVLFLSLFLLVVWGGRGGVFDSHFLSSCAQNAALVIQNGNGVCYCFCFFSLTTSNIIIIVTLSTLTHKNELIVNAAT